MNSLIRVGIPIIGSQGWIGGVSYVENLVKAVSALPEEEKPKLYLVVFKQMLSSMELHKQMLSYFDGIICVGCHDYAGSNVRFVNSFDELFKLIDFYYPVLSDAWPGKPAASWIPDFQHIHLPQLFSEEERQRRSQAYAKIAAHAKIVVFSSIDAREDFKKLFPASQAIVRVLPFHVLPTDEWYHADSVTVQNLYKLPDNFFICCNQFWTHKNHARLFEAVKILHQQGQDIHLVCTGATEDYRDPNYFPILIKFVKERGIESLIHILGNIPRDHQIQLIRRSLGVIQPSLFEGWSTVIEDCRALGKVMLLSDLSVHKEQSPPKAVFFDRSNPYSIAEAITSLLPKLTPGPARVQEALARNTARNLVNNFAHEFRSIAVDTIALEGNNALNAYKEIKPLIDSSKYVEASVALEKFLQEFPDYAPAYNDLGVLAYNLGNKDNALRQYEHAARLKPDNINYLKNLADFYYMEKGDIEKALDFYNRILAIKPDHVETLLSIGQICISVNNLTESKVFFNRVLVLDPGNEHARKALEILENIFNQEASNTEGTGEKDLNETLQQEQVETENDIEILIRKDHPSKEYLVSALVSTYNSERFIRECLEDLEAQTIADKIEIIVIDSCSQQNEKAIVQEFQQQYPNIVYLRTRKREKLYAAWNRGIHMARGKYITNTNTDDRRTPYALEFEARVLDQNPQVGLVYADIWGTTIENDILTPNDTARYRLYSYPDFTLLNGLTGSNFSPQPMWRRTVHEKVGFFDESYVIAGDYEFFYRVARTFNALHIKAPLGLYLENTSGIEKSQPTLTREEFKRLRHKFYSDISIEEFFPLLSSYQHNKEAQGEALFELGNNCIIASLRTEYERAISYYEKARDILGNKPQLLHNMAIAKIGAGDEKGSLQLLQKAAKNFPPSQATLKAIKKYAGNLRQLPADACKVFFSEHPVAKSARNGLGVELEGIMTHHMISENFLNPQLKHKETIEGMTSIIILTQNRLDQTKKCIRSIRKHTPEQHEIIFVDNGSTDGTVKWLQNQTRENKNCHLVENKENVGLVKGRNQAINLSQGEYILLLDNDVIVSDGWLTGMLECLNCEHDAGIVGPMANSCAGLQLIADESYRSLDYLDKYAAKFKEQNRHRRIPCRNIAGFCMLFRQTLAGKIGLFDERFDTGHFEDEDFCWRSALGGYQNYIAGDVFIHHHESKNSPGDRDIIEKKWTLSLASPEGKKLAVLKATELANNIYQKGENDQAVEALINCIKLTPDAKEIYYELARIFLASKQFAEAWDVVGTMPEEAKNDVKGLEYAGYAKEGLGLDDEASSYADKMLAIDDKYAAALNLRGVLAYKKDDKEKAVDYFKKTIGADPGYGEAYTNLGVLYWSTDKKDKALTYLQKGFVLSPTVPDVSTLYYGAISSLGTFNDAESDFREACRLYPDNKKLAFLHIDILLQQGLFNAAMPEIEDALVLFGLDEDTFNAALAVREKSGPLQIEKASRKNTLSLCMIVKNEEKFLFKCLKSVRDVVDEIIVVDTGSNDRTKDHARLFGAKVFDFPWTGDFSAARNHSLSQATGDWILILDADEVISSRDINELTRLMHQKNPSMPAAYSIVTRNYINNMSVIGWTPNNGEYPEEAGAGWVKSTKVRLFKRRKDVFFSNTVHEMLENSLKKAKIPFYPCNIIVHHYGKLDMERTAQKGEDYYLLGKIKHENDPTNVIYINELAKQAQVLGKYKEAAELWLKLISLLKADPDSLGYKEIASVSHSDPLSEIYTQLAATYLMLNSFDEALPVACKAMEAKNKTKEVLHVYAHCEIIAGSLDKAFTMLEELLKITPDYPPALFMMAVIFCLEGKKEKTQESFQSLLDSGVELADLLNTFALQFYTYGKRDKAMIILHAMIENKTNNAETMTILEILQTSKSGT